MKATDTAMELKDFQPGDSVKYIPPHAQNDITHSDCENGVVKSISSLYVFVQYIRRGVIQNTAEATFPENLKLN